MSYARNEPKFIEFFLKMQSKISSDFVFIFDVAAFYKVVSEIYI